LATLRSSLAGHPRVALAGAAYDGVGIASCLRSGEAAATQLHRALLPNAELVG
jgi:oxygen-dependent protoporphyrinogen oxidase